MQTPEPGVADSLVLALFALFLLASPFALWWMRGAAHWYLPYLFWLVLIGLTALLARRWRRHEL